MRHGNEKSVCLCSFYDNVNVDLMYTGGLQLSQESAYSPKLSF